MPVAWTLSGVARKVPIPSSQVSEKCMSFSESPTWCVTAGLLGKLLAGRREKGTALDRPVYDDHNLMTIAIVTTRRSHAVVDRRSES